MKKIVSMFSSKVPIVVALIAVQIVWFVLLFVKLNDQVIWISTAFGVLSLLMFLAVIASNQNPAYKIGWIIIIGLLPLLGGLLYALLGNKRPSRKLRNRIMEAEKKLLPLIKQEEAVLKQLPERVRATSSYINHSGAYPIYEHSSVRYFKIGEEMYASMLEDLRAAQRFIFFEYFIVAESSMWDGIKEILISKAKQGLDVRVMYDDMGSVAVLPRKAKKELENADIKVVVFNPLIPLLSLVMNNRDHRKILVIDGNIGYNGGINIADEYININSPCGHWKDTGLRLSGEAVWNLTTMFLSIWNAHQAIDMDYTEYKPKQGKSDPCESNQAESDPGKRRQGEPNEGLSDGFVQPFSDSPLDDETLSENVYMEILWQARDYVYIFTPYLIIDHEMQVALTMAAKRGVDVRIVVPGIPDQKPVYQLTQSYFKALIEAGVKIYLYTPGFIHAKSYISDDHIAIVGTINMDYRSLYLHFECGTFMVGCSAISDLKQDCLDVFACSQLLTMDDVSQGRIENLYRAILRVGSPLF